MITQLHDVFRAAQALARMSNRAGLTEHDREFVDECKLQYRTTLNDLAEGAITALDLLDGDPDFEEGHDLEDDFSLSWYASQSYGAGCPIADPDHEHDGREEEAGVLFPTYGVDQTLFGGGY